ncbi:MAG: amidohydrolase [Alphaproteobacteria bacterium]
MIVDTHVHIVSEDRQKYPQVSDGAHGAAAPTVRELGQVEWPATTIESLIATMDACAIDRALLVQTYFTYHYDNSYMIDARARYPDRFQNVCVIDQLSPESPDLLSKLAESGDVHGLRMMSARGPGSLRDPRSFPLWARAAALNIPVCLGAKIEEIDDVRVPLDRFPEVPVALEHVWGLDMGDPPYERHRPLFALAAFGNVSLKTAPNNSHAARACKGGPRAFFGALVEAFGPERIMWGSNYPAHWNRYGGVQERLDLMREDFSFLNAAERDLVFGGNALRFWPGLA